MLRCDGDTTHGPCHEVLSVDPEDATEDGEITAGPALFLRPDLDDPDDRAFLRYAGWLAIPDPPGGSPGDGARGGRVLCRAHVGGREFLAAAAIDGLPFDEPPLDELPFTEHRSAA